LPEPINPLIFIVECKGVVIILAGPSPIHEQEQYVDGILESLLSLVIGKRVAFVQSGGDSLICVTWTSQKRKPGTWLAAYNMLTPSRANPDQVGHHERIT